LDEPQTTDDGDGVVIDGMKMAEKTEELGGNVPRCPFVNHKSHTT
jgi:hypothetical protein